MIGNILLASLVLLTASSFPSFYFIPFPSVQELLDRPSGRPFTISVEGNVGAGKSTLLDYFGKYAEVGVYKEPLDIWQNLNGTNFLEQAYQDPERWGMTFESLVMLTMVEEHLANSLLSPDSYLPIKVMERSVHSTRACFIENLKPILNNGEMKVLDSWYRLFTDQPSFDVDVDLVIYLKTSPEVAISRVQSRSREEEAEIPSEFFYRMHQLHEDWLIHHNSSAHVKSPKVLVINADEDISTLTYKYENLAKMVWEMLPEELRFNK